MDSMAGDIWAAAELDLLSLFGVGYLCGMQAAAVVKTAHGYKEDLLNTLMFFLLFSLSRVFKIAFV